jgi:hypothetical protein
MNEYGSEIAYQVRFEGTKTRRTRTLFLTEVTVIYRRWMIDHIHTRLVGTFVATIRHGQHFVNVRCGCGG